MHSLAFGTLKPFVADDAKEAITPAQLEMTLDVGEIQLAAATFPGRDGG